MRNRVFRGQALVVLAGVLCTLGLSAAPQEVISEKSAKEGKPATAAKPVAVYRVDYTIREMEDAKVPNTRKYMLMVESNEWAQSRVGNRVPINIGVPYNVGESVPINKSVPYNEGNRVPLNIAEKAVTYDDVGMNIGCRVRERDDAILLDSRIEFSSVVPREQAVATSTGGNPVFRRVSLNVTAAVFLGKPTVIGSMDDVTSNRRFEIEATVTKVK